MTVRHLLRVLPATVGRERSRLEHRHWGCERRGNRHGEDSRHPDLAHIRTRNLGIFLSRPEKPRLPEEPPEEPGGPPLRSRQVDGSFQQSRYRLVDGLGNDILMKRVECFSRCRPDSPIVISERGADHVDNLVFALRVGHTLTVKPSTQRKRQEERDRRT